MERKNQSRLNFIVQYYMKKNKFVDNQKTMHASTSNRRLELTDLHLTGAGAILRGWGGSLVFICGQGLRGEGPWGGATETGGWGGQGGRFYRRFYLQLRFSQSFDLMHDTCQSTWHDNVTQHPIYFIHLYISTRNEYPYIPKRKIKSILLIRV